MNDSGLLFWLLAVTAALFHLKRWLAAQNVLAIGTIAGAVGLGLALLTSASSAPETTSRLPAFGPRCYFPPFWIAAVLSSRTAARMVASNWRLGPIGTLLLAAAMIAALAISAGLLTESMTPPRAIGEASSWRHAAWRYGMGFLGWAMAGLTTLLLIAPWLINKRSTREPDDLASLVVAVLPGLFLAVRLARQNSWGVVALISALIACVVATGICKNRRRDTAPNPPPAA